MTNGLLKRIAAWTLVSLSVCLGAASAQKEKVVYSFRGSADGSAPYGPVMFGANGDLYGTTYSGGADGFGTAFRVSLSGKDKTLHSFKSAPDGAFSYSGLVSDAQGNFYGTTYLGGGGAGTVFKMTSSGKVKVLYKFTNIPDGANPTSGVVLDAKGNIYGTTYYGGEYGYGTVYKVTPLGKETVLHSFSETGSDGAYPWGAPVVDAKGTLYATTMSGGDNNAGTVFKVTSSGSESTLYSFTNSLDGGEPYGQLILDAKGNIYGTTYGGGRGDGCVFKLTPSGNETPLYSFQGTDGSNPIGGLVMDAKGNFYGTTFSGGTGYSGTVFKLTRSGKLTTLYNFTDGADGGYPQASMVFDKKGALYGTTQTAVPMAAALYSR